jgi:hypothetical protein
MIYGNGVELPKVDFNTLDYSEIQAGGYFFGFDLNNGGLLSKMDHLGNITVIEGATGSSGSAGASGSSGSSGSSGQAGSSGSSGIGSSGSSGSSGTRGTSGTSGSSGNPGPLASNSLIYKNGSTLAEGNFSGNISNFNGINSLNIGETSYLGYSGTLATTGNAIAWLNNIGVGDLIQIVESGTSSNYGIYSVNSATDNGIFRTFSVAFISGNGSYNATANYAISYTKRGVSGTSGTTGTSGSSGTSGTGSSGSSGTSGEAGSSGSSGTSGEAGSSGSSGTSGTGSSGSSGTSGEAGSSGSSGTSGEAGSSGSSGTSGTGSSGSSGTSGTGSSGSSGTSGTGSSGSSGSSGAAGSSGSSGTSGSGEPSQLVYTTSSNFTTSTTISGYGQDGKHIIVDNGSSNITITCNGSVTASYQVFGTGSVTFVNGSGRTLASPSGAAITTQYGTAALSYVTTTDIILVHNV